MLGRINIVSGCVYASAPWVSTVRVKKSFRSTACMENIPVYMVFSYSLMMSLTVLSGGGTGMLAPAPAGAVRAAVKAAASVEYHLHHLGGVDIGGVVPAVTVIRAGQRCIALHACTFLEIVLAVVRIVVRVIGRNAVGVIRAEIALECGHVLGIALIAGAKVAKIEVFHCTVLHKFFLVQPSGGCPSLAVLLLSIFAVP